MRPLVPLPAQHKHKQNKNILSPCSLLPAVTGDGVERPVCGAIPKVLSEAGQNKACLELAELYQMEALILP